MAVMIPEVPRNFSPASQEGLMFSALSHLPNDYYVFHSVRLTDVRNNEMHENEIDFVILNRFKGVLCLEAKSGQIDYKDGTWIYGSGIPMHNGGPFNQGSSNKYKLIKYISEGSMSFITERCKFLHAVWFPSVDTARLREISLPPEADRAIILTGEALSDPEPFLSRIFAIELPNGIETDMSEAECNRLVREVFCPQFHVVPSVAYEDNLKKIVFHRLLKEQSGILDFLDEQPTAAVNGAAGTGKTMIATEKAHRHAAAGERVLFLCFNAYLRDYLEENYAHELISYFTVAGYACKVCGTAKPNYQRLGDKLEEYYLSESFPYRHVIIDEGQDFGNDAIEETDVIWQIHDIIVDSGKGGTFYVFYDRLQMVQAREMPKFIGDLDCRLTLYRNCRNTENIAVTSLRPVTEREPKVFDDAIKGVPAKLHFCDDAKDELSRIDMALNALISDGFKDIVLLTCKTEAKSVLAGSAQNGRYRNKYLFTTCRKFKGLEADAVILTDVNRSVFDSDNVLLFYVGASRARLRLDITAVLSDDDCEEILRTSLNFRGKIGRPRKKLAEVLNAIGRLEN